MNLKETFLNITDFDEVRERLFVRLAGRETMERLPVDVPRTDFMDLAVICGICLETGEEGMASAVVTERMKDAWGVDTKTLHYEALRSAEKLFPAQVEALPVMMNRQFGMDLTEEGPGIYIISNSSFVYGASAILYPGTAERAAELLKGSYYILPSSVHELLIVPETCGTGPAELKKMVMEVNASVVAPEERLSDSVYFYDADIGKLRMT